MLRRTPIFSALTPDVLGSGLQPDLHPSQKMLWEVAQHVSFRNGRIRRAPPNQTMFSAGSDPIRGITQHLDSNGVRWVWAASGGDVKRWYGPAPDTIISGDPWNKDEGLLTEQVTFWDMLPFGDWVILNSSKGSIRIYKPHPVTPTTVTLTDAPTDVVAVAIIYNFLVAFGFGGAKTRVGWSGSDDFETWLPAPETEANSLSVAEFNTPLRAVAPIGESWAMFAEDQMAVLNFVGQPFWFGYKMRLDGIGAVGKRAVASDGKNIVGVGRNGVWWTDGLTYRYIDEGILHDYLQEEINWAQKSKITAARNDVTGCFDFSFPMGDSLVPNEGWSFDPRVGAWYPIPAFSLKDERRLFVAPVVGTLTGGLELEQQATNGNPLDLRSKPLLPQLQDEFGLRDVHNSVRVDEVDIMLKQAENVEWRLGSCMEPEGTFNYTPWVDAVAGSKTYKTPKQAGGRTVPSGVYHKIEFRSTQPSWKLDLQGFQLFGNIEGVKNAPKS